MAVLATVLVVHTASAITLTEPGTFTVAATYTPSVPKPYGGLRFSADGATLYAVGAADQSGSALYAMSVTRNAGTMRVASLGAPVKVFDGAPSFPDEAGLDAGVAFGPSGTFFYSYYPSPNLAQRPLGLGGSEQEYALPGITSLSGLTFSPHRTDPGTGFGRLQISTGITQNMYEVPLQPSGTTPGFFVIPQNGSLQLFAKLYQAGPPRVGGQGVTGIEYIAGGGYGGHLLYSSFIDKELWRVVIDPATGLPDGGSNTPTESLFASGFATPPFGLAFDPIHPDSLFLSTWDSANTAGNAIIEIAGFAAGAPSTTTTTTTTTTTSSSTSSSSTSSTSTSTSSSTSSSTATTSSSTSTSSSSTSTPTSSSSSTTDVVTTSSSTSTSDVVTTSSTSTTEDTSSTTTTSDTPTTSTTTSTTSTTLTSCGGAFPVCLGTCPEGETCTADNLLDPCVCVPITTTSTSTTLASTTSTSTTLDSTTTTSSSSSTSTSTTSSTSPSTSTTSSTTSTSTSSTSTSTSTTSTSTSSSTVTTQQSTTSSSSSSTSTSTSSSSTTSRPTTTSSSSTSSTSTTLPIVCDVGDPATCDDQDPCTADACVGGTRCEQTALTGLDSVTCACERLLPPACLTASLPPRLLLLETQACSLFTQSRDLPPKKQRRRLVRGAKVLRKTILFATRAGGTGKISTECSIALVDLLHDTRERSKRLINVR